MYYFRRPNIHYQTFTPATGDMRSSLVAGVKVEVLSCMLCADDILFDLAGPLTGGVDRPLGGFGQRFSLPVTHEVSF